MEPRGGGGGGGGGGGSPSTRRVVVGYENSGKEKQQQQQQQNSSPSPDSAGVGVRKLSMGNAGGFDICPPKQPGSVVLKPSLLAKNREMRKSGGGSKSAAVSLIRPGMVLLRGYLKPSEQHKIVERCREMGVGSRGFYQPGYGESTKMHLKMMCLGKNWDPVTGQYGDRRQFDGAMPPEIPPEFHELVNNVVRDSNAFPSFSSTANPTFVLSIFTPKLAV